MSVSFDGLRTQLATNYTRLCNTLQESLDKDGVVVVPASDIQEEMDELRSLIGTFMCCYDENDKHFTDLSGTKLHMLLPDFNPDAE